MGDEGGSEPQGWMGYVPKGGDRLGWLRGPVGLKTRRGLGHMMNIQCGFMLGSLIVIYIYGNKVCCILLSCVRMRPLIPRVGRVTLKM